MTYTSYRGYKIEHLTDGYRIEGGDMAVYKSLKKAKRAIDTEFDK